jgi:flavin-dependent dehydrogenase
VTGFAQDDTGVTVELTDTTTSMRAQFLAGCDGGRSAVRKAAGIDFAGWDATTSFMIAEVEMREQPVVGMRPEGGGIGPVNPGADDGRFRLVLVEPETEHATDPTLAELRALLVAAYGTDYGVHNPKWMSRFSDMCRQAANYRCGRVLVAGDAAHVHSPHGGQGLNTGVQDAVNLGWKLAQVVPESLLDTYGAERHPIGARVLQNTMAQVALSKPDERHIALRNTMTELLAMNEPRRRIVGMLSALDVRYDLGDGHPLLGRRMPDLDITTDHGPTRVFALLHDARPVVLSLAGAATREPASSADRVKVVAATTDATCELPVVGEVDVPPALLIRPDGHVAWTGELDDASLRDALNTWFGAGV